MKPSPATWRWRRAFFSGLVLLALPLALLLLARRVYIRRKGLVGLREKLTGGGPALPQGRVILHGVSLGEVNLMRPLLPALARAGLPVLATTSTETGWQQLGTALPELPRAFWPLDLPWAADRFLARTRPRAIILLELEIWPLLLCSAYARGIPVILVNARVSERSFRGYRRLGALLRPILGNLRLALGQNGPWTARLLGLGARRAATRCLGSMKADMVRPATPEQVAAACGRLGLTTAQPWLLLASTSAGEAMEESVALAGRAGAWRARGWRIVICPRHPERGGEIAAWLASQGLRPRRSSIKEAWEAEGDAVVVDEIGRLGALYAACAASGGISIVGGSLGSGRGGQNMLESAAAGCCTVVGPDTRNFPDAMALLHSAGGVAEASADALPQRLDELAGNAAERQRLGAAGRRAWLSGRGATDRVAAAIASALA